MIKVCQLTEENGLGMLLWESYQVAAKMENEDIGLKVIHESGGHIGKKNIDIKRRESLYWS